MAIKQSKKTSSKSPQKAAAKIVTSTTEYEGVKMLGILHFVGNILSWGTLGLILVLVYLLVRKDELTSEERSTCYEIINFNISFILYSCIAGILIFVLIGFILLPIVYIIGIVLLIIGFTKHLNGENYQYPGIIRFVK